MKSLYSIHITLRLRAPWLVHGNDPGRLGLDAVQLRNGNGQRILPGSLLVGRVVQAWNEFKTLGAQAPGPGEWFGSEATAERRPQRARIYVDDLVCQQDPVQAVPPVSRVHIDEGSGAGVEGDLQFIEQNDPNGSLVSLCGTWRAWLGADEAAPLKQWLYKALCWQSQWGALRNAGFGVCEQVQVVFENTAKPAPQATAAASESRFLSLRFAQALAVGNRLQGSNLFVSEDVISGGTLKGALAEMLRAAGQPLPAWFNALRISHAHPSDDAQRPLPLPLSLVWDGAQGVFDAAACATSRLGPNGAAPAFQTDWKPSAFGIAAQHQGWAQTRVHLRVRTAIEDGQAAEGKLFAYETRVPGAHTRWLAQVGFTDTAAEQKWPQRWQELAACLAGGLGPIGKTDAFAQVHWCDSGQPRWPSGPVQAGQQVRVMLATPALLFASTAVAAKAVTPQDLHALYAQAFADLAQQAGATTQALQLSHFFAAQELAGGPYLWQRFMRQHPATRARGYLPYVLTRAGSVFVFDVHDMDKARTVLTRWQRHGLPLPGAVATAHGAQWDQNPYQPENGYGEIAVQPVHGFPPWAGPAQAATGAHHG